MMGIETCETACVPATEAGSLTAVPPTCAFLAVCACLGETREAGAMILLSPQSGTRPAPFWQFYVKFAFLSQIEN